MKRKEKLAGLPSPEEIANWRQAERKRVVVFREVEVPGRRAYPWLEMKVGESFWAPAKYGSSDRFGGVVESGKALFAQEHGREARFQLNTICGRVLVTRTA